MNETVARIVELLFEDVVMSDEVQAIHDEVMNNCQERFVDLLGRGLEEDEAIAAVVESLRGMEEVLEGYPHKATGAPAPEEPAGSSEPDSGDASFSAEGLRQVTVNLLDEDVRLEESPDGEVHVVCDGDEEAQARIRTDMRDGELRVKRSANGMNNGKTNDFSREFFSSDFKWENLGEMVGKLVRGIAVSVSSGCAVCIQVPRGVQLKRLQVSTTSGNVDVDDLVMDALRIESRSGDVRAELPREHRLDSAEFHTTSGDVTAVLSADQASAQSMSGDIRFEGQARKLLIGTTSGDVRAELIDGLCETCEAKSVSGDVTCEGAIRQLRINSTSGDIRLDAACETVQFGTVSGDVQLAARDAQLRSVEGRTTSGDVTIGVPGGVREADISFHSVSGDQFQGVSNVSGAPLRIAVSTVSGDLRVR